MNRSSSFTLIVLFQAIQWGCTSTDSLFCESTMDCNNGFHCHVPSHTCIPDVDGGVKDNMVQDMMIPDMMIPDMMIPDMMIPDMMIPDKEWIHPD